MNESDTIIAATITALATIVSVFMGQYFMNRRKKISKDCLVRETAQNANVYTALDYIMGEMSADRAYIMEFHNGDSYFSGRGQQKYSCTHEVVEEGVSSECELSQNHRVSNYHHYISILVDEQKFAYQNIESIEDNSFHQMLKRKQITYAFASSNAFTKNSSLFFSNADIGNLINGFISPKCESNHLTGIGFDSINIAL